MRLRLGPVLPYTGSNQSEGGRMRRVVVTGLGIVSSIGNTAEEVLASLKAGKSGITANAAMKEHGFRRDRKSVV